MTTTYFRRAPAFESFEAILDWSERHGAKAPVVYEGPDGSKRGSVEVGSDDNQQREESST